MSNVIIQTNATTAEGLNAIARAEALTKLLRAAADSDTSLDEVVASNACDALLRELATVCTALNGGSGAAERY